MNVLRISATIVMMIVAAGTGWVTQAQNVSKTLKIDRSMVDQASECITCHSEKQPGVVNDWRKSRHGHVGVSCLDCHQVEKDSPMAAQHCPGVKGTETYVSVLVTPKTCSRCHPVEVKEFSESGHVRAAVQIIPKEGLDALKNIHEGQQHPEFMGGPNETGCMQCHGETIVLDENRRPTPETWPNSGIGTIWPDGSIGNCTVCHTRHQFKISESRKPDACASCHLGPDHPNIEIFENSKHGHIYKTEGHTWNYESAPGAWEPGDYRAPTCAVCHMSGIGDLKTTHNVSARLKWNLWGKSSQLRDSTDPFSPLTGDHEKGRTAMKSVCLNCHSSTLVEGFFMQADKQIELYNEAYWKPAKKMHDELEANGLLGENPWKDAFQISFYHLWHHEGRRMRMGAAMGSPDYAHWHGSFEVMQRLYELEEIYKARMESGKIEPFAEGGSH